MPPVHRLLPSSLLLSQALLAVILSASSHGVCAQSASNGAVLYAALQCGSCHGGNTVQTNVGHIQLGVNAANIKNATYGFVGINIGTQMSSYKGIVDGNYDDLAAFIAQQVGGGVVATCTSAGVPTASSLATAVVCPPSSGGGTGTGSGASGAAASSGGGCTLGRTDASTDPLWMVLLGSAAMVLRRRRQRREQIS